MYYPIYNMRLLFLKSVIYIDLVLRVKLYQLVSLADIPQLLLPHVSRPEPGSQNYNWTTHNDKIN